MTATATHTSFVFDGQTAVPFSVVVSNGPPGWATTPAGVAAFAAGVDAALRARDAAGLVRITRVTDVSSGALLFVAGLGNSRRRRAQAAGAATRVEGVVAYATPAAAAAAAVVIGLPSFGADVVTALAASPSGFGGGGAWAGASAAVAVTGGAGAALGTAASAGLPVTTFIVPLAVGLVMGGGICGAACVLALYFSCCRGREAKRRRRAGAPGAPGGDGDDDDSDRRLGGRSSVSVDADADRRGANIAPATAAPYVPQPEFEVANPLRRGESGRHAYDPTTLRDDDGGAGARAGERRAAGHVALRTPALGAAAAIAEGEDEGKEGDEGGGPAPAAAASLLQGTMALGVRAKRPVAPPAAPRQRDREEGPADGGAA